MVRTMPPKKLHPSKPPESSSSGPRTVAFKVEGVVWDSLLTAAVVDFVVEAFDAVDEEAVVGAGDADDEEVCGAGVGGEALEDDESGARVVVSSLTSGFGVVSWSSSPSSSSSSASLDVSSVSAFSGGFSVESFALSPSASGAELEAGAASAAFGPFASSGAGAAKANVTKRPKTMNNTNDFMWEFFSWFAFFFLSLGRKRFVRK